MNRNQLLDPTTTPTTIIILLTTRILIFYRLYKNIINCNRIKQQRSNGLLLILNNIHNNSIYNMIHDTY